MCVYVCVCVCVCELVCIALWNVASKIGSKRLLAFLC